MAEIDPGNPEIREPKQVPFVLLAFFQCRLSGLLTLVGIERRMTVY